MFDAFEWDPAKAAANLAKHRVSLLQASRIFAGPGLTRIDDRTDYGEPRYISVGEADGRCLVVVHTPRDETTRIISARRAISAERASYYRIIHGNV
ncbi:MAG: BrnT family toxin [Rhodospirillales bacterium]